jgi:hypothetical protein
MTTNTAHGFPPGTDDPHARCPICGREALDAWLGAICDPADDDGPGRDTKGAPVELPDGATVEPWTDDDTAELAACMAAAANDRRDFWTAARYGAARWRAGKVAQRTNFSGSAALLILREAAAIDGLVPDPTDPDARARQNALAAVWGAVIANRAGKTTHDARYYESSDGFEERLRLADPTRGRFPLVEACKCGATHLPRHLQPEAPENSDGFDERHRQRVDDGAEIERLLLKGINVHEVDD